MKHPDYDLMMVMERRRDELAEAEHSRLVKEALMGSARRAAPKLPRPSFGMVLLILSRSLAFLGGHMLSWSCRLQVRYQAAEKSISPCG